MLDIFGRLQALGDDRHGITAVEYGLIAALMSAILVAIFAAFGKDLTDALSSIGGMLTTTD